MLRLALIFASTTRSKALCHRPLLQSCGGGGGGREVNPPSLSQSQCQNIFAPPQFFNGRIPSREGRKKEFLMWGQAGKDFPLVESESLQVLIGMHLDEMDSLRAVRVQETGGDRLQD